MIFQVTFLPLRPMRKGNKRKQKVIIKLVHSSSSFVIVQDDLLMAELNDRMIEMLIPFIDEENKDSDISVDLDEN